MFAEAKNNIDLQPCLSIDTTCVGLMFDHASQVLVNDSFIRQLFGVEDISSAAPVANADIC